MILNRTNPCIGRKFSKSELVKDLPRYMLNSHFNKISELCPNSYKDSNNLYGSLIVWNSHKIIHPSFKKFPFFPSTLEFVILFFIIYIFVNLL